MTDFSLACGKSVFTPGQISYRKLHDIDGSRFSRDIEEKMQNMCQETSTLDDMISTYNTVVAGILEEHAPLKTKLIVPKPVQPWMSEAVIKEIRLRRKLEWRLRSDKGNLHKFSAF